jgi:hypothetical protein
MAFCNSCGAALTAGTKFCNKCGAAVPAGPAAPGATLSPLPPAPPASTGGGTSTLKIILLIIAIIVGLGILSVGAFSFFVYRVAKSARVSHDGQHVKVETPFGNMETSKDPEQAAKDLGVDIYPGAQAQKTGNASMTFGNMHTVTASFQSSDSADKICDFYKSRLPNATSTSAQNRCNVIFSDQQNNHMITVNVQSDGDTSKIQIASVTKKASD